ncbi:S1C family serine protease [Vagococcus sp. JNUCC 83]
MRKDVTPNEEQKRETLHKKNNQPGTNQSLFKRFGISLAAGALGGLLVVGGYTVATNQGSSSSTSNSTNTTQVQKGKTTVSNVNVNVESEVTKAVEKVSDAVVSVTTLQKSSSEMSEIEKIFGRSSNTQESEGELQESGEGSGVIYRKDNGKAYIVTNNHVVTGADAVSVMLNSGKKVDAKIVGTDTYSDLAVLEISDKDVTTVAEFGNSNNIKVGETVLAIGSPLGSTFANSVSQGIISAKDRMISNQTSDGQIINSKAIQTDAAINPGNSGGALINTAGQVIGINSSKIASAASGVSAEGMGFAIPSNEVVNIINQLEQGKSVVRPMLGIKMVNLNLLSSEDRKNVLKLDDKIVNGVVVASVEKDTPAAKAGLKQYDVITQIDGKDISSTAELQSILYSKNIGDKMELTLYRNGKEEKATVNLTEDSSKLEAQQQKEQEQKTEQSSNTNSFN